MAAVVAHYDERAASYDDSAMHRALADAVAGFVGSSRGGAGGLVVDVATGTGLALRSLAAHGVGGPLVGVDRSAGMLAVARGRVPGALLVLADAAALPVADRSVGLLTCVTGLHLFPSPAEVAAEWARVVRPGGSVVTATFRPMPDAPPPPGGRFARNHAPYASAEAMAATFAPWFEVARSGEWTHRAADGEDRLLLCELRRRS